MAVACELRSSCAAQAMRWEREVEERNRPLSDEELDAMLPQGYRVLEPPAGYQPIHTPARKLMATPTPLGGTPLYGIPEEERGQKFDVPVELEGLPELKPEDHQYFGKLLKEVRHGWAHGRLQTPLFLTCGGFERQTDVSVSVSVSV